MKKNKSTILIGLLVVLLGVFALVKFTGNSGRSKSFKEALVQINKDEVTKVEILSPTDTTLLEKQGEGWLVNQSKTGEDATIFSMLKTLETIKPSRLASRSEDSWSEYEVGDGGTRVIVYEGSTKVLDIVLGKFAVEGQRQYLSYVRLTDDEDVYAAKDFMKMSISTSGDAYRNDDILKINKDSVSVINFNYLDSAFTLEKIDETWMVNGLSADSASVASYLQQVRMVTSRNFAESGSSSNFDVTFEMMNGDNLQISGHNNNGISSTYNTDEYWEDKGAFDKVFKGKGYFWK